MNIQKTLVVGLLGSSIVLISACNRNLRGWWRPTSDGKTYLVVEDVDGLRKEKSCTLDGAPWTYRLGEKGEIRPGDHELACPARIGFKVPERVEYHFDHWGP